MSEAKSRQVHVSTQLRAGIRIANDRGMKNMVFVLVFIMLASCARRVELRAPQFVRSERYSYLEGGDGRFYIVTVNSKDLDEAMKTIRPGPASVDKLDLWVITPLTPKKQSAR
jgi:hypothetical protein